MAKGQLKTVRFSQKEGGLVAAYLRQNPLFESFSALARVATLTFISQENLLRLSPVPKENTKPYFLWDYDIGVTQAIEILQSAGLSNQKRWLIEKILMQARFNDVLKYLKIDDIRKVLPELKLPTKIRKRWEYAIKLWSEHEST
ncbi:MAG: hypothetical protein HQM16_19030 [Deltaproteobacteria bacterium]|nr:hypothetical protein [Deltaproteobacteria bacterium]